MTNNLFSSKSFRIRTRVGIGIVLIVILGALTPNASVLRAIYYIATALAFLEVQTLTTADWQNTPAGLAHSLISMAILALSAVSVRYLPSTLLIISILLTMASDVGAFMVGKICDTKLIHARPFPKISPNKSWEGIIGGLLAPGLIIPLLNQVFRDSLPGRPLPIVVGCLAGLFAIAGDASESALKRHYDVKDANDELKEVFGCRHIEALLGGSEGHGGYYDRLDSMSAVLVFMGIVTVLSKILSGL